MRKNQAGVFLSLAAAVSLLLAVTLCCGYFGFLGTTVGFPSGHTPSSQRSYSLELDRGRVAFWLEDTRLPSSAPTRFTTPGVAMRWNARFDLPDWKRCFFAFDAHKLATGRSGSIYLFAFPIWCALVPCSIAPVMWLRRRGPRKQAGFAVITKSA